MRTVFVVLIASESGEGMYVPIWSAFSVHRTKEGAERAIANALPVLSGQYVYPKDETYKIDEAQLYVD